MLQKDLTATQTSDICKVNGNTVNRYFNLPGNEILTESIIEAKAEIGEYELDGYGHYRVFRSENECKFIKKMYNKSRIELGKKYS